MRLRLIPPSVRPEVYPELSGCPHAGCGGRHLQLWQAARKPLRDTVLTEVVARRYRCLSCGRTFRLYPDGVGPDRYLRVHSPADRFPTNRHFFVPIKDLPRHPTAPEVAIDRLDLHGLRVELRRRPTAYDLLVQQAVPDQATRYSANDFDPAPGELRTITVANPRHPLTAEQVSVGWR